MPSTEIAALEQQVSSLKKHLAELRRAEPPEPVDNHVFATVSGAITLADLFGDKKDLLVVHNMGKGCPYCTLWADGFNGVVPELVSRAAFVLVSPDPVATATEFAQSRGWRFPVVVDETKGFSIATGALRSEGIYPGVSSFSIDDSGAITRIAYTVLGEGDDFCATWHLFDLLKDGWGGWEPDYRL